MSGEAGTEAIADYLREVGTQPDAAIDLGAAALALAALDRPERRDPHGPLALFGVSHLRAER